MHSHFFFPNDNSDEIIKNSEKKTTKTDEVNCYKLREEKDQLPFESCLISRVEQFRVFLFFLNNVEYE